MDTASEKLWDVFLNIALQKAVCQSFYALVATQCVNNLALKAPSGAGFFTTFFMLRDANSLLNFNEMFSHRVVFIPHPDKKNNVKYLQKQIHRCLHYCTKYLSYDSGKAKVLFLFPKWALSSM